MNDVGKKLGLSIEQLTDGFLRFAKAAAEAERMDPAGTAILHDLVHRPMWAYLLPFGVWRKVVLDRHAHRSDDEKTPPAQS